MTIESAWVDYLAAITAEYARQARGRRQSNIARDRR